MDNIKNLQKALNNLKLKLENDIKSAIKNNIDLDMDKLFNDFEKYFKYKEKIKNIN